MKRFNEMVREIVQNIYMHYGDEVTGKERAKLHTTIRKMFPSTNLRVLYKGFYEWLGKPEYLKIRKGSQYEYADVYPLIYLKSRLEGLQPYHKVKHLIVDEMQDYSAVQYHILNRLFPCKKTILGDINQSVNPFSSSNLATIQEIVSNSECMTMLKSYRSTFEITEFTKKISAKVDVEAIERHGEAPQFHKFVKEEDELVFLRDNLNGFQDSEFNSLGIICKTQAQADKVYDFMKKDFPKLQVLNALSVAFSGGMVVTTAHLAKGLEFDKVLVPFVNDKNYQSEPDRQMLYVACTRAMHVLELSYTQKPSHFLD